MYILTDELLSRCRNIGIQAASSVQQSTCDLVPDAELATDTGLRIFYGGDGSPFTAATITDSSEDIDFNLIEKFFQGRAKAWELNVSPWASPIALRKAAEAGYCLEAFEGVLGLFPTQNDQQSHVQVDEVPRGNHAFAQVSEAGWAELNELPAEPSIVSRVMGNLSTGRYFIVRSPDGHLAAAACLQVLSDGAFLAGGSTRPSYRGLGYQQALIQRRLAAVPLGGLCLVKAVVGSTSYRNMQRLGFVPLYTDLVMRRTN